MVNPQVVVLTSVVLKNFRLNVISYVNNGSERILQVSIPAGKSIDELLNEKEFHYPTKAKNYPIGYPMGRNNKIPNASSF